jgi:hypothetical protein
MIAPSRLNDAKVIRAVTVRAFCMANSPDFRPFTRVIR